MRPINPGIFGLSSKRTAHGPPKVFPPTPASYGEWTFAGLTPGRPYEVSATWLGLSPEFPQLYQLLDHDGSLLGSAECDQTADPVGFSDGVDASDHPIKWAVIGTVAPSGSSIRVRSSEATPGLLVILDGVRLRDTISQAVTYLDDVAATVVGSTPSQASGQGRWYLGTYTAFQSA